MVRLLVVWTRAQHLSEAEAEAWARAELAMLVSGHGIGEARLSRLRAACEHSPNPWDWLLELEVRCDFAESPALREWLADLRLLGMHPAAMLVDSGRRLRTEGM